jgi:hypothetical protein
MKKQEIVRLNTKENLKSGYGSHWVGGGGGPAPRQAGQLTFSHNLTLTLTVLNIRMHCSVTVCGSFPHERQSTDVRCYATAC